MNHDQISSVILTGARRYHIADFIPQEYKLKMVAVEYESSQYAPDRVEPRCANGKCPLGWLFDADNNNDDPLARHVVMRLKELDVSGDFNDMYRAAREFIKDWDEGQITDLRTALGL